MQAVMHDITALLAMVRRQPRPSQYQDFESALHGRWPEQLGQAVAGSLVRKFKMLKTGLTGG